MLQAVLPLRGLDSAILRLLLWVMRLSKLPIRQRTTAARTKLALAVGGLRHLALSNCSPPHRGEKLSQVRHMAKGWIQARSMGVRHQVSNVPEETIQAASRMATRLASRR